MARSSSVRYFPFHFHYLERYQIHRNNQFKSWASKPSYPATHSIFNEYLVAHPVSNKEREGERIDEREREREMRKEREDRALERHSFPSTMSLTFSKRRGITSFI